MKYTAQQLEDAIRNASDLAELKRMVGPSQEESERNEKRLAEIDRIYNRYGAELSYWPDHASERYRELWDEQNRFESEYC